MAKNPRIETYTGRLPRCRACQAPLRPNYRSKIAYMESDGAGWKWVDVDETDEAYLIAEPPEDLTKDYEFTHKWLGRVYRWSARARKWKKRVSASKVQFRRFLGTFGAEGDGFFCNRTCAWRFAVMICSQSRSE